MRCRHCDRPWGRGGHVLVRCGEAAVPSLTEGRREAVWFCPAHASFPFEGAGYRRATGDEEAVLEVMSS